MIVNGTVYCDNTLLKSVASCGLETVVHHVQGWSSKEQHAPLLSGTAGHEALATYLRHLASGLTDYPAMIADALDVFDRLYREWATENVASDDRLAYDNVRAINEEFLNRISERKLPFHIPSPDFVEIGFSYPLDENGDFMFYGKMDFIGEHLTDRNWNVVDHKFTGRIDSAWVKQWQADSQITGYTWAALQHNPDTHAAYINAIELSKLNSSDRKCPKHGIPYFECRLAPEHFQTRLIGPITRTPEQLEEWRKTALSLAVRYKQLSEYVDIADLKLVRRDGTFTNRCRWCDFYSWCHTADRNETMLKGAYKIDHWMPFDPREDAA